MGMGREASLSSCTGAGPRTWSLWPVSQLALSETATTTVSPCFLKIFALKISSDFDLPQHSVDLPAHHASLGSLALWTHGLDSEH